jgi:hypothetical protein
MRQIEDAVVIYRISRAPERRIFYVDVGNLPKQKAEQYLREIMNRYRNKITYDSATGQIRDDRNHQHMLEDFWMPRREGNRGTEIQTLDGGQNLGEMEDVLYLQKKLYRALNVPIGRLQQEGGFSIGRAQEISRDEVKFNKFIVRLRKKFNALFNNALRVQLICKGIIRPDEWDDLRVGIKYDYIEDNNYAELRDSEIMQARMGLLQIVDPFVGKYYSQDWVKKNILRLDDKEINDIQKEMTKEQDIMIQQATVQGELQQAMQQPAMDAQAEQQQQAMQQQQAAQPQQDQNAQDQQEADAEAEQEDTQQSKGKVTKLKTGTWPN